MQDKVLKVYFGWNDDMYKNNIRCNKINIKKKNSKKPINSTFQHVIFIDNSILHILLLSIAFTTNEKKEKNWTYLWIELICGNYIFVI